MKTNHTPRAHCLRVIAVSFGFLLSPQVHAEDTSVTPRSALRAAMRAELKAKVQGKVAEKIRASEAPSADTVTMAPFVVKEKRAPRTEGLDEAMQKEKELQSHALYHTDLNKKVRIEVGLPPVPGGRGGGFNLPILRLSW